MPMKGPMIRAADAMTVLHNQEGNTKVLVSLAAICCSVAGGLFTSMLLGEDTVFLTVPPAV
jgi:hypothetical protein